MPVAVVDPVARPRVHHGLGFEKQSSRAINAFFRLSDQDFAGDGELLAQRERPNDGVGLMFGHMRLPF